MAEIIYKDESYQTIGACFEVYNQMGCGFLEAVYQECLSLELEACSIPFSAQQALAIKYKKQPLNCTYVPDFVCYGKIILEIKALKELNNEHRSQVHNYLKATGLKLGLLVNFGHSAKLEHERIVR